MWTWFFEGLNCHIGLVLRLILVFTTVWCVCLMSINCDCDFFFFFFFVCFMDRKILKKWREFYRFSTWFLLDLKETTLMGSWIHALSFTHMLTYCLLVESMKFLNNGKTLSHNYLKWKCTNSFFFLGKGCAYIFIMVCFV